MLVLLAVLIPALCLLWFMSEAMRNERFAARQKLAEAYRVQLSSAQALLETAWMAQAARLEELARGLPAAAAFAECVRSGLVDSVLLLDPSGDEGGSPDRGAGLRAAGAGLLREPLSSVSSVVYPNVPAATETIDSESQPRWAEASQLEYLRKDFAGAARLYDEIARGTSNIHHAARARQAQARCLLQTGDKEGVVQLIDRVFGDDRFGEAVDAQGRLIVANAELLQLELLGDAGAPGFQSTARRLRDRLTDYSNPALTASQRRFLMRELMALAPAMEFPTLPAEELAERFREAGPSLASSPAVQKTPWPEVWQFATQDQRVLALVRSETLAAILPAMAGAARFPPDTELTLMPPGVEHPAMLVAVPAGLSLPGWRLAVSFTDQRLLASAVAHRTALYFWTGVLMVATTAILSLLAVRFLRQQAALARLKNDLAATVSHELKTPLASIRVLVDTLLDAKKLEEPRVRDYLQLIARESERLTRLIQNFLAFSRMQRGKHDLSLAPVAAGQIVERAVEAVRERFTAPECRFDVEVEANAPGVMADPDAIAAALINLLDNAWKYSEESKHIVLRAFGEHGCVCFSVSDNGIGIAPRERGKIFERFYQVDRTLSRQRGGCGLGLSIVRFIAEAHQGFVSVDSEPGRGSTFVISLPALLEPRGPGGEAVAP